MNVEESCKILCTMPYKKEELSQFKSKVAHAAVQGDLTMAELVEKYDVHANQITEWKKQLVSSAPDVFGKGAKKAEDTAEAVQGLHARIGQLTMENVFFYDVGPKGLTCSEERNDRSWGPVAGDAAIPVLGSTSLDVLLRARAGVRQGVCSNKWDLSTFFETSVSQLPACSLLAGG